MIASFSNIPFWHCAANKGLLCYYSAFMTRLLVKDLPTQQMILSNSCCSTLRSVTAAALRKMLNRLKDHREQRPQLCRAQTEELKTGPLAGNITLERCRNAEHLSAIHTHALSIQMLPLLNFLPRHQTRQRLEQRTLVLNCTQPWGVWKCRYRRVQNSLVVGKLCKAGTLGGNKKVELNMC